METIRLGRTNIKASRTAFGALPIQRVTFEQAKLILRKAYENGINFFDTARAYTDSEEKIGYALSGVRKQIFIATKSHAKDKKELLVHLEESLRKLKTDYVDIFQFHNPPAVPSFNDPDGIYQAAFDAKAQGKIRFIGISFHKLSAAIEAAESKKFDTIQFPLSSLSSKEDLALVELCRKNDIGFIAMKALSGGLIMNAASTFAFLRQFGNVLPIWGIQCESELDEFLALESNPPVLDYAMMKEIDKDREELSGSFCRGCGYCQPCSVGIPIELSARMSLFLRRAPYQQFLTDEFKEKMERIKNCTNCGNCRKNCPYALDIPKILKSNLADYREFYTALKNK